MGRIFLVLIVVGMLYGGYRIYGNLSGLQDGDQLASRYKSAEQSFETREGEGTGAEKKTPQRASSREIFDEKEQKEPLPVISSSREWLQLEGWGIVKAGDELPDGAILRAWSDKDAIVTGLDGGHERRRFRRFEEALRDLLPVATAEPVAAASSWFEGGQ